MKESRDILAERPELRKMPYNLPEGYFDGFRMNMKPGRTQSPWKTWISVAASVVILITGGLLFSRHISPADEFTHEDFLLFSDSMINTEYFEYTSEQYAEAEMTDEDIIDYLIYSGISAEEVEQYK